VKGAKVKKAGVIYREQSEPAKVLAQEVVDRLWSRGIKVRSLASQQPLVGAEAVAETVFCEGLDLLVVMGGDGTLLRAAQLVRSSAVMVLGVKLGGLGFLTEVQPEELNEVLDQVQAGKAQVMERMMLEGQLINPDGGYSFRALNEVAITCSGMPRVIALDVRVDGVFVNSFLADGLLVSTPTGSTAYNMAAGGPIMHPAMRSLTITPVCPHTLTSRPLVIPHTSTVHVTLVNDEKSVHVSPDARHDWPLVPGGRVEIKAAEHGLKLVCSPSKSYYEILRTKLSWGER
jgi:NAD+ kinase